MRLLGTILFIAFCSDPLLAREDIIQETYQTRLKGKQDLNLFLRFPKGHVPGNAVSGVAAICKYNDGDITSDMVSYSGPTGHLVRLADEHGMAVVGFGKQSAGWNRLVSSDELSRRDAAQQDQDMDALAREWSRIITLFTRKHNLPDKDWLLYGTCGGAQYAHRVALRQPQHFKAVHIHYGGSYDVPTSGGRDVIWLITSWTDEPAYVNAQRFFRLCNAEGYRMILKGHPHGSGGIDSDIVMGAQKQRNALAKAFFEFAIEHPHPARTEPTYLADYVNDAVFHADRAGWIPKEQTGWLPNREVAEAWGTIEE